MSSYFYKGKAYIVSGSWDNTLRIWDPMEPDACVRVLHGHTKVSMIPVLYVCICLLFSCNVYLSLPFPLTPCNLLLIYTPLPLNLSDLLPPSPSLICFTLTTFFISLCLNLLVSSHLLCIWSLQPLPFCSSII